MKTTLQFFFFLCICAQVHAQIVNIPDPAFKEALLNQDGFGLPPIDTNNDGEIQLSEAQAVDTLIVGGPTLSPEGDFDIQDLTGIEAFVNITYLDCQNNKISTLELNQNPLLQFLNCEDNLLTNIDINQNPQLTLLVCDNNQLTVLDLTQNPNLLGLGCSGNQISNLDVTQNIHLTTLDCIYNQLTSLNLTHNTELIGLGCNNNQLENLDVRNGNNINLFYFSSDINPNLTCIFVDDATYMETNFGDDIDSHSTFVETQAECDAAGVLDFEIQHVQIYPNPVSSKLYIQFPAKLQMQNVKLLVTDVLGKTILTANLTDANTSINVQQWTPGLYFMTLYNSHKTRITKKIIKL